MTTTPAAIPAFSQLGLSGTLLKSLEEVGYETPSPIQAACIPHLLAGRDLLGQAQTGTGKTAAFALPALERVDLAQRMPQVLVLTPTRELAIQVAEAFQRYARHLPGFHVMPIYGGQSMVLQLRQLDRGVHVVVGTPGRVMDHLERKSLSLDALKLLVLDEADEMLRMGFIDDVEWILEHIPATRQTALFSATMPDAIRRVAGKYLRDPSEVKIKSTTSTVATIAQRYWPVSGLQKLDGLTRILEVESDLDAAIIFVRTKTETVVLAEKLEARGYAAAALNGDMTQVLRERTIDQLKRGGLDIVVATDVAARGLDVPRITHVINYDIPYDTEAYVHRIGRTGRAGRAGHAILFVAPREMRMLRAIEKATRQPITPMSLPSREAVANRRVAQFKEQVVEALASEGLDFFRGVVAQLKQEQNVGASEIAAALVCLLQRERPLQLPVAEREERPARVREAYESRDTAPRERPARSRDRESSPERERAPAKKFAAEGEAAMAGYRVEVGTAHGAAVKDLVGAIANETGLESKYIGQIKLFEDYSLIELPAALPKNMLRVLERVRVRQVPLAICRLAAGETGVERPEKKRKATAVPAGDTRPAGKPFKGKKPRE